MTPLTAEKIAELERLLAAATAGPWQSAETRGLHGYEAFILTPSGALGYVPKESERQSGCLFREADGQLIAAMHEALPYLLSLAKRVAGAPVVRFNDDGSLDEVVGFGEFHLEQMSGTNWWMQLGPRMVNLTGTFVCAKATSR